MREYLLVFLVAAATTYLLTVIAREIALRTGASGWRSCGFRQQRCNAACAMHAKDWAGRVFRLPLPRSG